MLLLLPTTKYKLLMMWQGPYQVVERMAEVDYHIRLDNGQVKTYHVNLWKARVAIEEPLAAYGERWNWPAEEKEPEGCLMQRLVKMILFPQCRGTK